MNNSGSAAPFHQALPLDHDVAPAGGPDAAWRLHYRQDAADLIAGFDSSDAATEAACRLLDSGSEVMCIGAAEDEAAIGRERLALIYALWVRARYH